MSHTRKHQVWSGGGDYYDARVYSSGGVLHTAEIECASNGRTYRRSFRSRYDDNRRAAIRWAQDELAKQEALRRDLEDMRNTLTTFINSPADMAWLLETHLSEFDVDDASARSAVLHGNEDCPDKIELFDASDPTVDDVPTTFVYDDEIQGYSRAE